MNVRYGLTDHIENWELIVAKVPTAIWETIAMISVATVFTVLLGLPLGTLLSVTSPRGLRPQRAVYQTLSVVVSIGRSTPFIILMIALIPFTRFVVGTTLGWQAAAVPLAVGAVPFFARIVQSGQADVSVGKIEAAKMAGASTWQLANQVLLREARPSLIAGLTVTVINLISYSAMAGTVGGGGLGSLAYYYGYQRFMPDVMFVAVAITLGMVQLLQFTGDRIVKKVTHN